MQLAVYSIHKFQNYFKITEVVLYLSELVSIFLNIPASHTGIIWNKMYNYKEAWSKQSQNQYGFVYKVVLKHRLQRSLLNLTIPSFSYISTVYMPTESAYIRQWTPNHAANVQEKARCGSVMHLLVFYIGENNFDTLSVQLLSYTEANSHTTWFSKHRRNLISAPHFSKL